MARRYFAEAVELALRPDQGELHRDVEPLAGPDEVLGEAAGGGVVLSGAEEVEEVEADTPVDSVRQPGA